MERAAEAAVRVVCDRLGVDFDCHLFHLSAADEAVAAWYSCSVSSAGFANSICPISFTSTRTPSDSDKSTAASPWIHDALVIKICPFSGSDGQTSGQPYNRRVIFEMKNHELPARPEYGAPLIR